MPAPVSTRSRYEYAVDALSPTSSKLVEDEPGWAISMYWPVEIRRSTRNRAMPTAEEVQDSRICDAESTVAMRIGGGGNGKAGVVAEISFE